MGPSLEEAERACQKKCYGDCPLDVIKLLAHKGQAQVSCAVAVATAMQLTASSRDGPFWSVGILGRSGKLTSSLTPPSSPLGRVGPLLPSSASRRDCLGLLVLPSAFVMWVLVWIFSLFSGFIPLG